MKIRPVTPADIPDIARLTVERGFPPRSETGWQWVLFNNPEQAHSPSGYVIESDGQVVAFLGGMGHRLHGTGTAGFVVAAHTFVSDFSSPGHGPRLIRHGFKHTEFDATYTLHNNALSAIIYKRFGLAAIWQAASKVHAESENTPGDASSGVFLIARVTWPLRSRVSSVLANVVVFRSS